MQALLEITEWSDPNANCSHLYWMDGDKAVGYSKWGKEPPEYFKNPIRLDKRGRKFVEVKNHPFKPTIQANIIKVQGSKGAVYEVNLDEQTCTCSGFKFRGGCKHLKEATK